MRLRWPPLVLLLLALGACKSGAMDGAKETFAAKYTCPEGRIEARVREDVTETQLANRKKQTPPAEVAADPGRLALWQKQEAEKEKRANAGQVIVEARGCGHEVIYSCGYASQHASTSSPWLCMSYDYPPSVKKW
ncbi:MAG TPA: hypothetical protein VIY73_20655 [Polyangiaceae bacterium]